MTRQGKGSGKGLTWLALPGLAVVVASLLLAGKATAPRIGNPVVPEPLKPVDLPRYLGRWYEFARYDNRSEWHCEAVTAEYFQRPDGLIGIVSTSHCGSPEGRVRVAGRGAHTDFCDQYRRMGKGRAGAWGILWSDSAGDQHGGG